MNTWLKRARKTSDLTPEDCASAIGCCKNTYDSRESEPGTLSIDEIRSLHRIFNKDSRYILWDILDEFKP